MWEVACDKRRAIIPHGGEVGGLFSIPFNGRAGVEMGSLTMPYGTGGMPL